MHSEARKIHVIEEVLKINSNASLIKLEDVLKELNKLPSRKKKKPTIYDFVGMLTKDEANEMRKAIKETSENIHPDDWR